MIETRGTRAVILALGLGLGACTMQTGGAASDGEESVGAVQSALANCDPNTYDICFDDTDSSGKIHTRTYACKFTNPAQHPTAFCLVEPGYVLVGGGADVNGTPSPGAMLTASYPVGAGPVGAAGAWLASSKDHQFYDPHQLQAYAIGLKIDGLSASDLQKQIKVTPATSGPSATPAVVAVIPDNHVLLGGGAQATTSGPGQLLFGSFPTSRAWVAYSKQHNMDSPGTVTAYAVSMPRCPSGVDFCVTNGTTASATGNDGFGYQFMRVDNVDAGAVVTGVGAYANTSNPGVGRLLTHMYPYTTGNGGAVGGSKDHAIADHGSVAVYAITLKKM